MKVNENEGDDLVINSEHTVRKTILVGVNDIHSCLGHCTRTPAILNTFSNVELFHK